MNCSFYRQVQVRLAFTAIFFVFPLCPTASSLARAQEATGQENVGVYAPPSKRLVVTAGVPRNWPPHYMTDDSGNPEGFAIEAMNEIARIANVDIRYRAYDSFSKVTAALREKKVDLIPNMGIADFRKEFALYTGPVETFLVSVFVRSGTLTEAQLGANWLDIVKGRTTAVVASNVGQRVLRKHPEVPIIVYQNIHEAIIDLIAGRVDALAYPEAVVRRITASIGIADEIQVAGAPIREIKRGVAVRNNFPELHERLSVAADRFVKSSKYEEIYSRWFGSKKAFWTTRRLILFIGIPVAALLALLTAWRYFSVMRLNQRLVESRESLARLNTDLENRVLERTREIAREKQRAENYLNIAGTMIVAVDETGHISLANQKACDTLGRKAGEMIGRNWFDIAIPESQRSEAHRTFKQIQIGNLAPVEHIESNVLTRAGKQRLIAWHHTFVTDEDGCVRGCLSAGEDITDNRQMQEQLVQSSKMATLGEMATGVAHELNQPLNVIRMAVNNIQRKSRDNKADPQYLIDKLGKVERQIERATAIIDHMRIFGRKPGAEPQSLDPVKMVEGSLSLIGEQLRLSDISVGVDSPETSHLVKGHQVQIEQVLLNLLSNARDALRDKPAGDKRIHVSVRDDGADIRISVADSGGGIAPDVLPRIFEPFYTTKDVGMGTGLGLSISYGIINDMGGTIKAENTADGARFTITLPTASEESSAA